MPKKNIPDPINPVRFRPILPLVVFIAGPIMMMAIPYSSSPTPLLSLKSFTEARYTTDANPQFFTNLPVGFNQEYVNLDETVIQLSQYQPLTKQDKIVPYFDPFYDAEEWFLQDTKTPEYIKKLGYKYLMLRHKNNQQKALLLYRFEVGRYNTSDYMVAKLLQLPATFLEKRYSNFFSAYQICASSNCETESKNLYDIANSWHKETQNKR